VLTSDASGNASWQAPGSHIYFFATSDTNTVLTNGITTNIPFSTVVTNDGSGFSNNHFTAPSAGLYHFDLNLVITGGGGYLLFMVNNNTVASTQGYLNNTSLFEPFGLSTSVKLAANDVVSVAFYSYANNKLVTFGNKGNNFSGYKVY
jgi:C1q domain